MKTIGLTTLLLACMALSVTAQEDPREIMERSREQSRLGGLEAKTVLEIHDGKGNQRIRETRMVSRVYPDKTEKRAIIFLAPADVKGTGVLIFDYDGKEDNMWIYVPALRKSRKIVSSEKSKNFMGSEFSNSDLTVENPDDFNYELEGTESIDDQSCWKIRIKPSTPQIASEYGISEKTVWVSRKDLMPRKALLMGADTKPWKEIHYSGIRLMDQKAGKYFISRMEVKNLKNGRFSRMEMSELKYNPEIREDIFTLSYIEKQ